MSTSQALFFNRNNNMSRKDSREGLYKLVFEFLFLKQINDSTLKMLCANATLTDEDKTFVQDNYLGIIRHFDELTEKITKYTTGYTSADRLVKADYASMLISTYEMLYVPSVPPSVSINEAVELVKQFSTDKSSGFVNGVLASIKKEIFD